MASTDIERLAQDLLEDIAERQLTEIVVASDGRLNSLSSHEFDELRARMSELAPKVKRLYAVSCGTRGRHLTAAAALNG